MASGNSRLSLSEPRRAAAYRRTSADQPDVSSLQEDRLNNWEFFDWRPSPMFDTGRIKKGNQEKEREKGDVEGTTGFSREASPGSEGRRRHTPATVPRTRGISGPQQQAMHNLRQHLSFSDNDEQGGGDSERNNERYVPSRRDHPALQSHDIARNETGVRSAAVPRNEMAARGSVESLGYRASNLDKEGMPDGNQILSRLMQIRDYIKQAAAMMDRLTTSADPEDRYRSTQLEQVISRLREQEQKYLELLLKLSTSRDEDLLAKQNSVEGVNARTGDTESEATTELDMQSNTSEDTTDQNATPRPRIEDNLGRSMDGEGDVTLCSVPCSQPQAHGIKRDEQHSLAAEVASRQKVQKTDMSKKNEELEALKLQHELLKKMLSQKEQLRALQGRQEALAALQQETEDRLADERGIDAYDHGEQGDRDGMSDLLGAAAMSEDGLVPQELQDLRQQLDSLKNIYSQESASDLNRNEEMTRTEQDEVSMLTVEQNQLKDKLQELQEKKEQMDELLQELNMMRDQKYLLEQEGASSTSSQVRLVEGAAASASAEQTASDAQHVLQSMAGNRKTEKLQEVRSRLDQLRGLMQYYQSGGDEASGATAAPQPQDLSLPAVSDYEDPQLMQNLRELSSGEGMSAFLAQYAQQDAGTAASEGEVEASTQTQDEDLQMSEELGAWADDPEIKLKVKRLKVAKEKLRRLQDLVGLVTQTPEIMDSLPAELAQLASSLDNDIDEGQSQTSDTPHILQVQAAQQQQTTSSHQQPDRREQFYQEKMDQQRQELAQLTEERQKLLDIQEELQRLHDDLPSTMAELEEGNQQQPPQRQQRECQQPVQRDGGSTQTKQPSQQPQQEQQVTFQEPLATVVPNDEVYNRMRQQRVLREELREKKRVLENMMRKDTATRRQYQRNQDIQSDNVSYSNRSDTGGGASASEDVTMATWGGSTAGNLESIEEDEDDQRGEQRRCNDPDDDGYPSDGIVQVEEEEEANVSDDRDTYTIEDEFGGRHSVRRSHNSEPSGASGPQGRRRQQSAPMMNAGREGPRYRYNYWAPEKTKMMNNAHSGRSRGARQRRRQENLLWAGEIPEPNPPSMLVDEIQQLRQQVAALCSMQASRDNMSLLQPANHPPTLALGSPGMVPGMNPQVNSQLYWLNNVYSSLARQQHDMSEKMLRMESMMTGSGEGTSGHSVHAPPSVSIAAAMPNPFTLNPSFPDGFTGMGRPAPQSNESRLSASSLSHHQASLARGPDESTPLSHTDVKPHKDRRSSPRGGSQVNLSHIQHERSSPHGNVRQPVSAGTPDAITIETVQASDTREAVPKLNLEELLKSRRKVSSKRNKHSQSHRQHVEGVSGLRTTPRRAAAARLASQVEPVGWRPGLSAGISGTAYDAASMSSVRSSVAGEVQTSPLRSQQSSQEQVNDTTRDQPSDTSTFEALRETIYAEVATLISQNESRPHFLIELFRELQMLNNDYLRQRGLYAVQELVTRNLTEADVQTRKTNPHWMTSLATNGGELTPSESIITDEEEDEKNDNAQRPTGRSSYDYIEPADNTSEMSTPSSHASPFARDSLGDTVIHFDKAIQHMREYERRLGEEQARPQNSSAEASHVHQQAVAAKAVEGDMSDIASSSAQGEASDDSISENTYPHIDTGELDQEIKAIMREVIPVLKGHMGEVCSAALLAYVRRLVLTRARQQHPTDNQVHGEFTRFFHNQLAVILQDSLAKFEGRKMRECGEDLLVELSEMLFNELAFFRLMQDLDGSKAKVKAQLRGWRQDSQTSTDTGPPQEGEGTSRDEDEDSSARKHRVDSSSSDSTSSSPESSSMASQADSELESDDNEEMDVSERDDVSDRDDLETGDVSGQDMVPEQEEASVDDEEEDQLGKERDDEFAAQIEIVEREEDVDSEVLANSVKIELAPSETKPYTRIGSDEDDEGEDEVASAEDPSETAVSRDAEKERSAASSGIDMASSGGSGGESDTQQQQPSKEQLRDGVHSSEEKEKDESEACYQQPSQTEAVNGTMNGQIDDEELGEIGIDDLPPKLAGITKEELAARVCEEAPDGIDAVLDSMQDQNELAGDPMALPAPDGPPLIDSARTP